MYTIGRKPYFKYMPGANDNLKSRPWTVVTVIPVAGIEPLPTNEIWKLDGKLLFLFLSKGFAFGARNPKHIVWLIYSNFRRTYSHQSGLHFLSFPHARTLIYNLPSFLVHTNNLLLRKFETCSKRQSSKNRQ